MIININVIGKHATTEGAPVIVCGNSGYSVEFTLSEEWDTLAPKTARFVYVQNGAVKYEDVVFTGTTAAVPVLSNTKEVRVGLFAGDLQTSTPARIPCELSIRCGTGAPAAPTPSQYDQIMQLLSEGTTDTDIAAAVEAYLERHPIDAPDMTARSEAAAAQTAANEAKTAAADAQTEANEAKTAAADAQTEANEAKTAAAGAQTEANEAKIAAAGAQAEANEAKKAAANAAAIKAVLYEAQSLSEEEKAQVRANLGISESGGSGEGGGGVSPVVTIEEIEGGHTVVVTDALGVKSFDVMDGTDGQDGTDATVTREAVEEVLTGNVTTHIHSQYLTAHQDISGKLDKSNGVATGQLKAWNNTNYSTFQIRNVALVQEGTAAPTGGNGDIYFTYEE